MSELTLYVDAYWSSPYAFSAFVALEEKQLQFKVEELSIHKREHRAAFYREGSLTGRLPALKHGSYWLSESQAIAEYLDETFPAPKHPRLFPEDLQERGRARQLMAWVRSDLMPLREERSTNGVFYPGARHAPGERQGSCRINDQFESASRVVGWMARTGPRRTAGAGDQFLVEPLHRFGFWRRASS